MPYFDVNATVSFPAWLRVEADDPEQALDVAREHDASYYDYDTGSGEVEFNVSPSVQEAS